MHIKFNNSVNPYVGDCFKNRDNTDVNITLREIDDAVAALADIQSEHSFDNIMVYDDPECTSLNQQLKLYSLSYIGANAADGVITLILKRTDIDQQIESLTTMVTNTETSMSKVAQDVADMQTSVTGITESVKQTDTQVLQISSTVTALNNKVNPVPVDPTKLGLDDAITYQLNAVNEQCAGVINGGFDIETSLGTEHFSLTTEDQANIQNLATKIAMGATEVPYHADGEYCRAFSAAEFGAIVYKMEEYILVCTTKCNLIRGWIKRCTDTEEVLAITFASELPDDLQERFDAIINLGKTLVANSTEEV